MISNRRLIPILAAVLVIQGLVGVLPHSHAVTESEIPGLRTADAESAHHECLACSVHTPAVEAAVAAGIDRDCADSSPITSWGSAHESIPGTESPHPRGPPRGVVIAG